MRTLSIWLLALALGCEQSPLPTPAVAAERPPNLIVIYSDDHGYADLGCQGIDPDVRTPHLDAMAASGVRCSRGYVSAPQCVPSRAGLLTGCYQQRFGVDDNLQGPLPLEERTIAELLQPAGYVSGQVGKWHLEQLPSRERPRRRVRDENESDEQGPMDVSPQGRHNLFLPHAQGFDEYFCGTSSNYVASHDLKGTPLRDAPDIVVDNRFRIDVQSEAALSFIRRLAAQPFCLYLAYFAPHVPLESPEPWFSRTRADLPLQRRQALAMIAAMDDGVGRIRSLLRKLKLEQETLIVFIGDNGAPLKDGAWNGSLNGPLVGEKGMLTDGGVRVPFLLEWPGRLPANSVYDQPVFNLDIAATALAAAGLPPDARLDGVDLLPFLTGKNPGAPHDALFWRWRSQAAVLSDGWKFVRLGGQQRYLFDLRQPEGERVNLVTVHADRTAQLDALLTEWDQSLERPGLPQEVHLQDERFFREYVP